MTLVKEADSTNTRNVWSIQVNVKIYKTFVFTRGGLNEKGEYFWWDDKDQTVNVSYEEEKNTYLLCEADNGGNATVTAGTWDGNYGLL